MAYNPQLASNCRSLLLEVRKLSQDLLEFVRTCRPARHDLNPVSQELASIETVLELLQEDSEKAGRQAIADALQAQITNVVSNFGGVLNELKSILQRHKGPTVVEVVTWTSASKSDVEKLYPTLQVHTSVLNMALELIEVSSSREVRKDMQDTQANLSASGQDSEKILAEIARLRALLPDEGLQESVSNYILDRYLEDINDLTSFAELTCEDWSNGDRERTITSQSQIDYQDGSAPPNPITSSISPTMTSHTTDVQKDSLPAKSTHRSSVVSKAPAPADLAVALSSRGTLAALSPDMYKLVIWDISNDMPYKKLGSLKIFISALAFSPLSDMLASGYSDGTIRVWKPNCDECLNLVGHKHRVNCIDFSPTDTLLASGSLDGTLMIWDLGGLSHKSLYEGSQLACSVKFLPNSTWVVSLHFDSVRIWDYSNLRMLFKFEISTGAFDFSYKLAVSPNGDFLATYGLNDKFKVWDLTGKQIARMIESSNGPRIRGLAISTDGMLAAAQGVGIWLWDSLADRNPRKVFEGDHPVMAVAFVSSSTDLKSANGVGTILESIDKSGTIRQWKVSKNSEVALKNGNQFSTALKHIQSESILCDQDTPRKDEPGNLVFEITKNRLVM